MHYNAESNLILINKEQHLSNIHIVTITADNFTLYYCSYPSNRIINPIKNVEGNLS